MDPKKVNELLAEYNAAQLGLENVEKLLSQSKKRREDISAALEIARATALTIQENAHKQISGVVTKCLAAVFGEKAYEFQIVFEQKRGRTEPRFILKRDGLELDPLSSVGGGVVDVAAFALRLACLALSKPAVAPLVVLDEPFQYLSKHLHSAARQMLETISADLGVQILMITHTPKLIVGKIVQIGE